MPNPRADLPSLVPQDGDADAAAPADGAAEKAEQEAERLQTLEDALIMVREKYLRTAYLIARGITGRAGTYDDVPEIDDLSRTRHYYDEVLQAVEVARKTYR